MKAMDLQSILDYSDVDAQSDDENSSNIDLERLLREDDDYDSITEERNDITITSMSTIETNAIHFSSPKHTVSNKKQYTSSLQMDRYYQDVGHGMDHIEHNEVHSPPYISTSMRFGHLGTHNPEDWAVLQQILGEIEDDDDEDGDNWINPKNLVVQEQQHLNVDEILRSIPDGMEDTGNDFSDQINSFDGINASSFQYVFTPEHSPIRSPYFQESNRNSLDNGENPEKVGEKKALPTPVRIHNNASIGKPKIMLGDFSPIVVDEFASENALKYALAYENKLLRPGQREIISPLMVKRRLKPKVELGSSMQRKLQLTKAPGTFLSTNMPKPDTPHFAFSGVLEEKVMPNLTAHLMKVTIEKKSDIPTAVSVNSKFIAVGTRLGLILVFDLFEVLRQKLRVSDAVQDGHWNAASGGSVTSVDISGNGEALIAGYSSGLLILWDVLKGTVLKFVSESHFSSISAVRFLNQKDLKVVSVDSGGLVNKLTFTKNLLWSNYSMDTVCLLDGTAGQILSMNVLPPYPSSFKSHNSFPDRLSLIALASERSSFAVAVEPTVQVIHRWARPTFDEIRPVHLDLPPEFTFLPCLSWNWSFVLGGGHTITPILARSWGCKLQFLRANFPQLENGGGVDYLTWPSFGLHDEYDSPSPILVLEWLGDRSLAYITDRNEFTVIDTVMMTLLERLDLSIVKLVYAEFVLNRSAGKDFDVDSSKQIISRTCKTFQNTLKANDNRILILCQEEVRSVEILGAKRRISALEEDGEWLEALALALDHYENTIKSQEDRQRLQGKRDLANHPEFYSVTRTEDEEWIAKLVIRYFNLAIENAPDDETVESAFITKSSGLSRLDLAASHFQMLAGVCAEFCIAIRRLDLLFGPIFQRFLHVRRVSIFLDVLEPYVLNDKLNFIAPEAMAHFIEHCKATNGIAVVERCLLHMDVTVMDFDSIVSLLRRNDMFSALFHVYTHGLDDFVRPLELMMEKLFDLADEGLALIKRRSDGVPESQFELLGYKAILYLQRCFTGKSFPQNKDLQPEDKVNIIRPLLLEFLQRPHHNSLLDEAHDAETTGHRALSFPYIRLLLLIDARALLDLMNFALDAPDSEFLSGDSAFESIGGWEVEVGADAINMTGSYDYTNESQKSYRGPDRQKIIDMLASIILPDEAEKDFSAPGQQGGSPKAVNAYLDFLAGYLAKGTVRVNISVSCLVISRITDKFRSSVTAESRASAQSELIELLIALPRNAYDPVLVLRMIEDAGIHRAALLLHQQGTSAWHVDSAGKEGRAYHFKCAIDCYLGDNDAEFRSEVFEYVKKVCSGINTADDSEIKELKHTLLSKLPDLINHDSVLSAQLIAELYVEELDDVITSLGSSGDNIAQFILLHAIISGDLAKIDVVSASVLSANLSMKHHQIYLALMAKLHPDMVYEYLSTHDNYRHEECLELCQKYDIADASAYLLEKMGNVSNALQLILKTFESRMMSLKRTVRGLGPALISEKASQRRLSVSTQRRDLEGLAQESKQKKEVDGVKRILGIALDLCERNSGSKSNTHQGSQLWFNVMDRLMNAKGFLRLSKEDPSHAQVVSTVLSNLLQVTMQRMVSSVPLNDVLRKITLDSAGNRLVEVRELIMCLLRTYGQETDVFCAAVKVMKFDAQLLLKQSRAAKIVGAPVRTINNQPIQKYKKLNLSYETTYNNSESNLKIDAKGDASFDDSSNTFLSSSKGTHGLASALSRLQNKRTSTQTQPEEWLQKRNVASLKLSMLPQPESEYYFDEALEKNSEAEYVIDNLGEAQSYGSLYWLQSP
jgi:vacuolar protein sorting-associated protein 8